MTTFIRRTLCIVLLACSALAADDGKYTNAFHGISFRPPAGGIRSPRKGKGLIAQWGQIQKQKNTPRLLWSLSLQHNFSATPNQTLVRLSLLLEKRIRALPGGVVSEKTVVPVGPYKALLLKGQITHTSKLDKLIHFRYAWIELQPSIYLTLKLDTSDGKPIATRWNNLWGSLKMVDPAPFRQKLKIQIAHAKKLLASLPVKTLHATLERDPQWFLLKEENRVIGWRCLHNRTCLRTTTGRIVPPTSGKVGTKGFRVRAWSYLRPPGKAKEQASLSREIVFLADDRKFETWRVVKQEGLDQTAKAATSQVTTLDGLRQNEGIVNIFSSQGDSASIQQQTLSPDALGFYLPMALDSLLPKLLNRTQPQAYTFTSYNTKNNLLTMRTVTMIGAETVSVNGQRMRAIKLTDQPDMGDAMRTIWINPTTGKTLRIDDGKRTYSAGDQKEILSHFSDALGVIKSLNDAEAISRNNADAPAYLRPGANQPGQPRR